MELRNRIGEGGRVMDTQNEYIACVNRLFFGFETIEEYREMLELLIQLRTPKLSKDFKPSVINDILSNSLQTLSEDDLRPMSEAIENMDSMKTNSIFRRVWTVLGAALFASLSVQAVTTADYAKHFTNWVADKITHDMLYYST